MTSPEIGRSSTTNTLTCTCQTQISPDVYFSKNISSASYQHPLTRRLPSNSLLSWSRSSNIPLYLFSPASHSYFRIRSTHSKPIRCYNAATHRKCCVILRCPDLPADNPQQSEEASHMGGNANCKCRKCKQGGPHAVVESDEGYHKLHYVRLKL